VSIVALKLRNGSGAKGTQEGRDVVIDIRQNTLFPLSPGTNTSRNTYARPWEWVAASAWTPRILAALENGVRGGKWVTAGPMPTLKRRGCSTLEPPLRQRANPL